MSLGSIPALLASALMVLVGLGAALKPSVLARVGLAATNPLGRSELRAVFGGMFMALGFACLLLRDPLVFAVVGAAWLADVGVRVAAVFADRVPAREALPVLGVGLAMGLALASGYWLA